MRLLQRPLIWKRGLYVRYVQILAIQKSTEYVGEKLNYLHDKHISSSSLHIYAQVEHYFGDYNLPKDKWMLEKIEECDDGMRTSMYYVPTNQNEKIIKSKESVTCQGHDTVVSLSAGDDTRTAEA